ncbi:MAG: cell filamentation protein Fic [Zetaproteobacteria bacterium CG2_30_46_52]|nr:MAG: cell filamentation protein Fic [Zetaproteobacteria bacterium CG2_30_46_52]
MSYQPPFTVTTEIVTLISAISEQVGFVQRDYLDASPQLRKANRIKTITGTLQIEGSSLSEAQVSAVLDGKPVLASEREFAEVKGAIAAYDKLNELNPLQLDHLLEAHRLMMDDVLNQAGVFRDKQVGIYKGKEVVHVAPPAHQISGLMAELFDWVKKTETHPLITSSVFHYEFEFIHPFIDGNGRMGRLWQTLLLAQWKPLFADMPLESVIKSHQQDYYQALGSADSQADSTVFITFMLRAILQTLENAPVNAPQNAPVKPGGLKTPEAILALVEQNQAITRAQIAEQIGKDIRTIGRAIKKLQDDGKLRRVGSDKTGYWELLGEDK